MVISVQGDHLLSLQRDMCAREHKNLSTYTPGAGYSSRLGAANLQYCDEKAIGISEENASLSRLTMERTGRTRSPSANHPPRGSLKEQRIQVPHFAV